MYRPTRLDQLEMLMPPRCPLGPIFSDMLEVFEFETQILIEANLCLVKDGSGANLKVFPLVGGNKEPAIISLT